MFDKIKSFLFDDYDEDDDYYYLDEDEDLIIETIRSVNKDGKNKRSYRKINEEERIHCLELYDRACAFDEMDAAAVMAAIVHKYPDICLEALEDYMMELKSTVEKYEEIERGM